MRLACAFKRNSGRVGIVRVGSIAPDPASAVLQRTDAIARTPAWTQQLDQPHPSTAATKYCFDRFPGTLRPIEPPCNYADPYQ